MIVVVVIAVLAAIGYPSYQSYVARGKRSDAEQLISEIALKQGQYIIDARAYSSTAGAGGLNIARQGWTCAATCSNTYYTISVAVDNTATPPTFSITGTPTGTQAGDGTLSLDNTGAKTRMVAGVNKGW